MAVPSRMKLPFTKMFRGPRLAMTSNRISAPASTYTVAFSAIVTFEVMKWLPVPLHVSSTLITPPWLTAFTSLVGKSVITYTLVRKETTISKLIALAHGFGIISLSP